MSIAPIGGVGSTQSHVSAGNVRKQESSEAPGVQDHDGDSDKASAKTAPASTSRASAPGRVDVKG